MSGKRLQPSTSQNPELGSFLSPRVPLNAQNRLVRLSGYRQFDFSFSESDVVHPFSSYLTLMGRKTTLAARILPRPGEE